MLFTSCFSLKLMLWLSIKPYEMVLKGMEDGPQNCTL